MIRGEEFEKECYEYLKEKYQDFDVIFKRNGGMDSTKSDIEVFKNRKSQFFIEVKDAKAQSGQFVVLPDEETKTFSFSASNRSKENEMTKQIICFMNSRFSDFCNAGTKGILISLPSAISSQWIVDYYQQKRVRYIISRNKERTNYIIFPVEKMSVYFDIQAKYRVKKSGSRKPAQKDIPKIKDKILEEYPEAVFHEEDKKLYVSEITIGETKFLIGKYTYFLSEQSEHDYEVRKLSNTNILLAIAIIIKYDIIKMGTKCKINIQLNQKEYALVHYEMECI